MRKLALDLALLSYWESLVYLEAALLAEPSTAHLAPPVTALIAEYQGMHELDLASRRAVLQSNARVAIADFSLDGTLRRLHSEVLGLVTQNRKAREFTTLFATDIGTLLKPALGRQVAVAKDLLGKLALPLYPQPLRDGVGALVLAATRVGDAVLDGRKTAALQRTEAKLHLDDWKATVNDARLTVLGELMKLGAKNGGGKAWAEAFFGDTGGAHVDELVGPAVAPAAGEPPATERPVAS